MGYIPSKACWTLLFRVWVLCAFEAEEGAWPPVDGGLEVRLMAGADGGRIYEDPPCRELGLMRAVTLLEMVMLRCAYRWGL